MIAIALLMLSGTADEPKAPPPGARKPAAEPKMLYRVADRKDASRTLQQFSECVVETQKPARLNAYLSIPPESAVFGSESLKLADDRCAPSRLNSYALRFQPNVMRAGLYDALYRVRFRYGPVDISSVPPIDFAAEFDASKGTPGGATLMFRSMGDCIARAHPAEVRALLMTRQGSDDEKRALEPLKPSFGSCLRAGNKIAFSPEILRGMLAEALYKLSVAARAVPGGEKR